MTTAQVARAATAALVGLMAWSGMAAAQSCADESTLRSDRPGASTELSFRNGDTAARRIYWLDAEGRRRFYGAVEPGNVYRQPTSEGHAWLVTDEGERCLSIVTAGPVARVIELGRSGATLTPPPPGYTQPSQPPVTVAVPPSAVTALPNTPPQSPVANRSPKPVSGPSNTQIIQRCNVLDRECKKGIKGACRALDEYCSRG